jgi:hypothetical protein
MLFASQKLDKTIFSPINVFLVGAEDFVFISRSIRASALLSLHPMSNKTCKVNPY